MTFYDIVFSQSDNEHDDIAPHDTLYNVEGVVLHGATVESIIAVTEYLSQWDGGMSGTLDELGHGSDDDVWIVRPHGDSYTRTWTVHEFPAEPLMDYDYILSGHSRLGYVGLTRYSIA